MGEPWFFFSYASSNRDSFLKKFFQELENQVKTLTGHVGYVSWKDLRPGADWPLDLAGALQSCKVFVPIYTPAYFESDYCGREWQIIRERQDLSLKTAPAGARRPAVIIPVLWVPRRFLPSPLPAGVGDLQFDHERFGEGYVEDGLKKWLSLFKHHDRWMEFASAFADFVVTSARSADLPRLPEVPQLRTTRSYFTMSPPESPQPVPPTGGATLRKGASVGVASLATSAASVGRSAGPRYVQFVFVAGRREELKVVRESLEGYGDQGGIDWQPYFPEVPEEIGIVAQSAAADERLHYEALQLDDGILDRLREAEGDNKIVAVVVDAWTLSLSSYASLMTKLDEQNLPNCVVLAPWNLGDQETVTRRQQLEDRLKGTFARRAVQNDTNSFDDAIASHDELKGHLSRALTAARGRILNVAEVKRRAGDGPVIARPIL